MRLIFFLLTASICYTYMGCKKEEAKKCLPIPAGDELRFRVVDTTDADVLFSRGIVPVITQPCRTTPLVTDLYKYHIGNANDSAVIISFGNLRTPAYSEGVDCFRILFDWGGDKDTVDWHYRSDEKDPGCVIQTIDYVSFNGKQAQRITDNFRPHYLLVK